MEPASVAAPALPADESVSLWIRNIADEVSVGRLKDHLSQWRSEINDVYLPKDYNTGRRKGYGFVKVNSRVAADIIAALHNTQLAGRTISVELAKESRKSSDEMRRRDGDAPHRGRDPYRGPPGPPPPYRDRPPYRGDYDYPRDYPRDYDRRRGYSPDRYAYERRDREREDRWRHSPDRYGRRGYSPDRYGRRDYEERRGRSRSPDRRGRSRSPPRGEGERRRPASRSPPRGEGYHYSHREEPTAAPAPVTEGGAAPPAEQ